MSKQSTGRLVFAGVTFVYLIAELVFNTRLVDVAGGLPTREQIHDIEIQGRMVSAVGASLVGWRLLMIPSVHRDLLRLFKMLLIGLLTIGPIIFFGQRLVVDHLANSANPASMRRAMLSVTVAKAMQRCVVSIRGLDMDCAQANTAEWKTFRAVLPAISYLSGSLLDSASAQAPAMVRALADAEAGSPDASYRQNYLPHVNELRKRYNTDYLDASQKIASAGDGALDPEQAWSDYEQEVYKMPFTLDSANEAQRQAVIKQLHKRKVDVPANWRLNDKAGFIAALPQNQGLAEFRRRVDAILGGNTTVLPGLSWQTFSAHPDVQRYIKDRLKQSGGLIKVPEGNLPLDADLATFRRVFFDPAVKRSADDAVARLKLPNSSYAPGGSNHQDGFEAMRAVIVPPWALCVSLLFGLLNLGSVMSDFSPGGARGRILAKLLISAAIVLGPFALNNLVTRSTPYQTMAAAIQKELPMLSTGLSWLMRAEPAFYRLMSGL